MHQFSSDYILCVNCGGKLELEIFDQSNEINEGFLYCGKCTLVFPIIMKIPILWNDFGCYLQNRKKHGTLMYQKSKNRKLKSFIKKTILSIPKKSDDKSYHEQHWTNVYVNSKINKFYSIIKNKISKLPRGIALEHGCSIGLITKHLAKCNDTAFGIDRSFISLLYAKNTFKSNLDYFVSDSLNHPFAKQKFDTIIALNLLEIIEPIKFLASVSLQINSGTLIVSDPYDNKRGSFSVKKPVNSNTIRLEFLKHKFQITTDTKKPSFIPWKLKIDPRIHLEYKTDLIIGKKYHGSN